MPNLLVAPNGFGKSTLAVAFESLKFAKIELKKEDYYGENEKNEPFLEIELLGENACTLTANSSKNEISKKIDVFVINSPVYAKSTSKNMGKFATKSAKLEVENLIFMERIPKKAEINYSIRTIKSKITNSKVFNQNLVKAFKNHKNIIELYNAKNLIDKCTSSKRLSESINQFLESLSKSKTIDEIKSKITETDLQILKKNKHILNLFEVIKKFEKLPIDKNDEKELFLCLIQIIEVFKDKNNNIINIYKYFNYISYKSKIDERLKTYNTTGRELRTKEKKGKLVLEFSSANKISNGERDILSFISNLSKIENNFQKKIGILIIDEIFDYLDGSNMLTVQYYISKFICECKKNNKIIFPIILTHLDPQLFKNYYFKKYKTHYLKKYANNEDEDMLKLIQSRNEDDLENIKDLIESYYLHFNPTNKLLNDKEKSVFSNPNYHQSFNFYKMIHKEVELYLNGRDYAPLKVLCGIRVKIEKLVYEMLKNDQDKIKYIETHTTAKKMNFAMEKGAEINEIFFLLQPLYNEGLHLDGNLTNKIQSTCLKLDNSIVLNIIKNIYAPSK